MVKKMYSYYSSFQFQKMVDIRIRAIRDETSARLVREKYQPDVPVAGLLVGGVGATSGLRLWMCRARVRYA